jgi:hypothetical protein
MDMIAKLPAMSDDALSNLRTNAKRLQLTGSAGQRSEAAVLLPAVEAEMSARRVAKVKAIRTAPPKARAAAVRPARASRRVVAADEC